MMRELHLIVYDQPKQKQTYLLLSHAQNQLLKAILPRPYASQAIDKLAQSLSFWFKNHIHVVVSVAEREDLSAFEIHDGFGGGIRNDHYRSDIHIRAHCPRNQRISGYGSFRKLQRLVGDWS